MADPVVVPETAPVVPPDQGAVSPAPAGTAEPVAAQPAADSAPLAAEPKVELTSDKPSLLETVAKPEPAKPAEVKPEPAKPTEVKPEPAAEAKPAEAKPAEAKAEASKAEEPAKPAEPPKADAPVEYKYTLPATMKMDDALKSEVHKAFDEFRANPAEGAQKLIDLHNKTMEAYAADVAKTTSRAQHEAFNTTREQWNKRLMADEVVGGSGHVTAAAAVARMRDLLTPPEMLSGRKWDDGSPRISEMEEFLRVTGAGDHPVFWRILHNAARWIDEPQAHDLPTDIKPSKTNGRAPKAGIYSHPSSQNMDK